MNIVRLAAMGLVQHPDRRTGVAAGEIHDHDGRLYATGSATCLILSG